MSADLGASDSVRAEAEAEPVTVGDGGGGHGGEWRSQGESARLPRFVGRVTQTALAADVPSADGMAARRRLCDNGDRED